MELNLERDKRYYATIVGRSGKSGNGYVMNDGREGLLFSQWKDAAPLPIHGPMRMHLESIGTVEITKAIVVAPFVYRILCGAVLTGSEASA